MENVCHRGHAEHLSNHNNHCLHRYKALTALWLHSIAKSFQNLHDALQHWGQHRVCDLVQRHRLWHFPWLDNVLGNTVEKVEQNNNKFFKNLHSPKTALPCPNSIKSMGLSCCLVTQSCQTLRNPLDCSTSGFPVLYYLPEFAQTHIHWVNNAIQPSHPLLSPSPPTLNLSQHQGVFQWVGPSHQAAKVLELQFQRQSMGLRGTIKRSLLIFPVLHFTLIIAFFWAVVS